jgi:hypothetical protein
MSERNLQPLEVFDARLVQAPLQGLLRNMDAELARLLQKSMSSRDPEAEVDTTHNHQPPESKSPRSSEHAERSFGKGVEKDSQESIPVFGVITPAAGYRTRESF